MTRKTARILIVVIAVFARCRGRSCSSSSLRATDARKDGLASARRRHRSAKSIAVLPFENLSDDKGNAYFADGIQDEILTKPGQHCRFEGDLAHLHREYKGKPEVLKRSFRSSSASPNLSKAPCRRRGDKVRVTCS